MTWVGHENTLCSGGGGGGFSEKFSRISETKTQTTVHLSSNQTTHHAILLHMGGIPLKSSEKVAVHAFEALLFSLAFHFVSKMHKPENKTPFLIHHGIFGKLLLLGVVYEIFFPFSQPVGIILKNLSSEEYLRLHQLKITLHFFTQTGAVIAELIAPRGAV
ncbi:hypothetical protein ACJX0J_041157, partial [Zea mays]